MGFTMDSKIKIIVGMIKDYLQTMPKDTDRYTFLTKLQTEVERELHKLVSRGLR